jgi:hypothetical protein
MREVNDARPVSFARRAFAPVRLTTATSTMPAGRRTTYNDIPFAKRAVSAAG